MLEKTNRINQLYDFYYRLLTEKQRQYMELYYHDDLSLSEIAEQFNVSRQAVYEHLKRAEQLLNHYESQLQMLSNHELQQRLSNELLQLLEDESSFDRLRAKQLVEQLKNVDEEDGNHGV